jgi:hypothetical protein
MGRQEMTASAAQQPLIAVKQRTARDPEPSSGVLRTGHRNRRKRPLNSRQRGWLNLLRAARRARWRSGRANPETNRQAERTGSSSGDHTRSQSRASARIDPYSRGVAAVLERYIDDRPLDEVRDPGPVGGVRAKAGNDTMKLNAGSARLNGSIEKGARTRSCCACMSSRRTL